MPFILLPVLLTTVLTAAETRVRVIADRTSLRYRNSDNVEAACVVPAGQELIALGTLEGNWVPVAPPYDFNAWIYAELVRKDRIVRDKTQVRSGPGLNFKVIGSLNHGAQVESRGRVGDWMKIKPPTNFPLWISRTAIIAAPAATSAPPDTIAIPPAMANGLLSALTETGDTNAIAATTNVASAIVAPQRLQPEIITASTVVRPMPPEISSLPLATSVLQGRHARFTGALRLSMSGATVAPARLRISGPDSSGGIVTFCHLLTPAAQLDAIPVGTTVTIEGPAWWLKGETAPVVKVEKVTVER